MKTKNKILFIAANPKEGEAIKFAQEYREIKRAIKNSQSKKFKLLAPEFDVYPDDFVDSLDQNPWLIHFCGHGYEGGDMVLQKANHEQFVVNTEALLDRIKRVPNLKCFLFSSCFSNELAEKTQSVISYAIGFEGEILNEVAIEFSKRFYKNFTLCETIPHAFRSTLNELDLKKMPKFKPVFKTKDQYIMQEIILKKNYSIEKKLSKKQLKKINKVKNKIHSLGSKKQSLFCELIKENPFPDIVFWFKENKEKLAKTISKKVLVKKSNSDQKRFARELRILFIFIETTLTNFDYRGFKKQQIKQIPLSFKISFYRKAFDGLIKEVPKSSYSDEEIAYLLDNARYLKSFLE